MAKAKAPSKAGETTSKRVASIASKVLRDPKSTPDQLSLAGTALTQKVKSKAK